MYYKIIDYPNTKYPFLFRRNPKNINIRVHTSFHVINGPNFRFDNINSRKLDNNTCVKNPHAVTREYLLNSKTLTTPVSRSLSGDMCFPTNL